MSKGGKIDKNPKLEGGCDVGNALAVVNDEGELLDDPKHIAAETSSSKDTPGSKLGHQKDLNVKCTSDMEVEHNLDEIFEVSTGELVNVEKVVQLDSENIEDNVN